MPVRVEVFQPAPGIRYPYAGALAGGAVKDPVLAIKRGKLGPDIDLNFNRARLLFTDAVFEGVLNERHQDQWCNMLIGNCADDLKIYRGLFTKSQPLQVDIVSNAVKFIIS